MKPFSAALLAGLLCVQTVSSLYCFKCDKVEDNAQCYHVESCGEDQRHCTTKYFGGGKGDNHKQLISKGCSATCPDVQFDVGMMAFSMKCCDHSFCNVSGAVGVKTSSLLLLVGTLISIFYILGAKL
ncbi:lymphocyte-antigen-6E-like [Crotalus adamanteus]|uniref:Lymphocyte-antigen-6E-like n=1 Tax=Crotalus adamanteus TaxID=8729 RepID=A0AAW1BLI6_CROAD